MATQTILKVTDLCKTYITNKKQNNALRNVSFNVDKGEMVADVLGLLFEQMAGAAEESMEGGTDAGAEVTAPAE